MNRGNNEMKSPRQESDERTLVGREAQHRAQINCTKKHHHRRNMFRTHNISCSPSVHGTWCLSYQRNCHHTTRCPPSLHRSHRRSSLPTPRYRNRHYCRPHPAHYSIYEFRSLLYSGLHFLLSSSTIRSASRDGASPLLDGAGPDDGFWNDLFSLPSTLRIGRPQPVSSDSSWGTAPPTCSSRR